METSTKMAIFATGVRIRDGCETARNSLIERSSGQTRCYSHYSVVNSSYGRYRLSLYRNSEKNLLSFPNRRWISILFTTCLSIACIRSCTDSDLTRPMRTRELRFCCADWAQHEGLA